MWPPPCLVWPHHSWRGYPGLPGCSAARWPSPPGGRGSQDRTAGLQQGPLLHHLLHLQRIKTQKLISHGCNYAIKRYVHTMVILFKVILQSQHHGFWWPGNTRILSIRSLGIDQLLITKRGKFIAFFLLSTCMQVHFCMQAAMPPHVKKSMERLAS